MLSGAVLVEASQTRGKPSSAQGTARAKHNESFGCSTLLKGHLCPASGDCWQCDSPEPSPGAGPACLQGLKILLGLGSGAPLVAVFHPSKR